MDKSEHKAALANESESSSDEEAYDNVDDDEEEDEDATEEEPEPTNCLFCSTISPAIEQAIAHLDKHHKVNLVQLQQKFQMDQYAFIKLINYIRCEKISAEKLLQTNEVLWSDEKYLKPQEYEPWLCYDYEALQPAAAATVPELLQRIAEQAKLLQQANEDMERMREDYKALMQKTHDDEDQQQEKPQKRLGGNGLQARNNPNLDKEYFNSYSHFGIHHEMLSDNVRTSSYRNALLSNAEFVRGKTVLDVGCGTGILSIFASQAGADRVVGVDNSDIAYTAMDIVRKNNIENVQLVKGRLEDVQLAEPKYDIIISEWMGYFLLYEGMLDSIIYAREHHLKPGGIILPNRCTLSILGYGNDQLYAQQIEFWSDVYGVNMRDLRKRSVEEPLIDVVDPEFMLTDSEQIANFDMMTVDLNYSNFTHEFSLKCTQSGTLSAFVGYFDTLFELPTPVTFGTSPTDTPTHWKQTVFFIDQPQPVKKGDLITGKITSRRHQGDVRALTITIEVFGRRYKYTLD